MAFFCNFKDENNKDHGEQRDKIEEDKIPSEGTIWQTWLITFQG